MLQTELSQSPETSGQAKPESEASTQVVADSDQTSPRGDTEAATEVPSVVPKEEGEEKPSAQEGDKPEAEDKKLDQDECEPETEKAKSRSRSLSKSDRSSSSSPSSPASSRSRSRSRSRQRKHRSKRRSSSRRRHRRSRSRSDSYSDYRSRSRSRHSTRRRRSRYSRSRSYNRSRSPSPYYRRTDASPCRVLGVFGLNFHTEERDLRRVFDKYGDIDRIKLVTDPRTGRSRGFAFIYYGHVDDAGEAKEKVHGSVIDGNRVRVEFSISNREHQPTPGIYMGRRTDRSGRYEDEDGYYPSRRSKRGGGGYSRTPSRSRSRSRSSRREKRRRSYSRDY